MQRLPGWFKQRSNRLYPVSVPLSSLESQCLLRITRKFKVYSGLVPMHVGMHAFCQWLACDAEATYRK